MSHNKWYWDQPYELPGGRNRSTKSCSNTYRHYMVSASLCKPNAVQFLASAVVMLLSEIDKIGVRSWKNQQTMTKRRWRILKPLRFHHNSPSGRCIVQCTVMQSTFWLVKSGACTSFSAIIADGLQYLKQSAVTHFLAGWTEDTLAGNSDAGTEH